ncbi:MAG: UvrB/UvrC motif-containing protein [Candidatus Omnitrophica bacterium]|nr:UvrB/UvrC motif-containing protein [Candidatus Omnitrophota bacterium]MDD5538646.1 UvrB/UvrC motif-containing protein [Candidatus Omnitrophota bacterium]
MLCNICNKNQATVHLTEIVDNQMTELHLCDDCAKKKSIQMEQQFGLSDLLAGLVDYSKQLGGSEKMAAGTQCPFCGLTYEDFRKIGRLGCSECYTAFGRYLGPLLKRIHGASQHVGKTPLSLPQEGLKSSARSVRGSSVTELKTRLQEAVDHEEFEEAARLRDAIKEAEKKKKETKKENESE